MMIKTPSRSATYRAVLPTLALSASLALLAVPAGVHASAPRAGDFAGTLHWQADWDLKERVPHHPTGFARQRCLFHLFFTGHLWV
jgi:hypothetical protein